MSPYLDTVGKTFRYWQRKVVLMPTWIKLCSRPVCFAPFKCDPVEDCLSATYCFWKWGSRPITKIHLLSFAIIRYLLLHRLSCMVTFRKLHLGSQEHLFLWLRSFRRGMLFSVKFLLRVGPRDTILFFHRMQNCSPPLQILLPPA